MRFVILHRFHKGVNLCRHNLSLTRHIAANHQYDTEFADGVREGKNNTGKESGLAERNDDSEKSAERRGAQRRGHFPRNRTQRLKGILKRLNHEGKRINHRADQEPRESKGKKPNT